MPDVLRAGDTFELFYNQRHGLSRQRVRKGAGLPPVSFADLHVKLADMTGDGLTDLVLVGNYQVTHWPYLGYGHRGGPIAVANAPDFEDAGIRGATRYDPRRLLIGDVDHDWVAHLVRHLRRRATRYSTQRDPMRG
jgi:hypothetical protein